MDAIRERNCGYSVWPDGSRLLCRQERPHPGAQLCLFDTSESFRHTAVLTDQGGEVPARELADRLHARV